jgi:hypothetical protein
MLILLKNTANARFFEFESAMQDNERGKLVLFADTDQQQGGLCNSSSYYHHRYYIFIYM